MTLITQIRILMTPRQPAPVRLPVVSIQRRPK